MVGRSLLVFFLLALGGVGAVSSRKRDRHHSATRKHVVKQPPVSHFHPHDAPGESQFAVENEKPTKRDNAADSFRFAAHRADARVTDVQTKTAQQRVTAKAAQEGDREPSTLTKVPPNATPSVFERYGSSSVVRGNKLYVFGGVQRGGSMPSNELLSFDLDARTWTKVDVYSSKPPGRLFHSASLSPDGKRMYITGGTPCFSRVFQKSLSFDDANGQYVAMLQHATTETLSIEHSVGFDDVYAFDFDKNEWIAIKSATIARQADCKAATNVFYNGASSAIASPLLAVAAAAICLVASVSF